MVAYRCESGGGGDGRNGDGGSGCGGGAHGGCDLDEDSGISGISGISDGGDGKELRRRVIPQRADAIRLSCL